MWERNTLHFQNLEHIIGFFSAYLFAVVCSLSFHSYCHVLALSFYAYLFKELLFSLLLELSLVFMFILLRELVVARSCVLTLSR